MQNLRRINVALHHITKLIYLALNDLTRRKLSTSNLCAISVRPGQVVYVVPTSKYVEYVAATARLSHAPVAGQQSLFFWQDFYFFFRMFNILSM